MGIFKCQKCSYQTTNKTNFDTHINRKNPCNPNKPNKNIRNNIEFSCKVCNRDFTRLDSLNRHNRMFHSQENNGVINTESDNTNNIVGDHNNQTVTNISHPIININVPAIVDYTYNDINDLTLFEQYCALTSKTSPYTSLLDHLNLNPNKPKYNNMYLGSINKGDMKIHNGTEWLNEALTFALQNVVSTKKIMISIIFNRFRCFLSNKATHFTKRSIYYGSETFYLHKKVVHHIKLHLYNKRKRLNVPNSDVPSNRNDPVWWALSKSFTWDEVETLMTKMDKIEINYDKNIREIKAQIITYIENNPKKKKFFDKFLKKLDKFICDFDETKEDDKDINTPDSSSEEESNVIEV